MHSITSGVDYKEHMEAIPNGGYMKLKVWDTAGQEHFRAMNRQYFRDVTACVLVYDVSDEGSFKDLEGWLEEFLENCSC